MDNPSGYEIRIQGHLTDRWSDWFDGLTIRSEGEGISVLSGKLADQAELIALLNKFQALNLTVIEVKRL